jgi:hypothetical protein
MEICEVLFGYQYQNETEENNFSYIKSEKDKHFLQVGIMGNERQKILDRFILELTKANSYNPGLL